MTMKAPSQTLTALSAAAALAMLVTIGAHAQSQGGHAGHGSHAGHSATPTAGASESTKAFEAVNAKMHADMAIKFTGNADVDFVRGMIPHHQGAIDMARVVLQHGKDTEVRKLAEGIIAAQEQEIAMIRAWQAKQR